MKTSTISFTVELEDSVNPLLIQEALWKFLDCAKIEVIETEIDHVTEEENQLFLNYHD